jgi:hypothetical protein
MGGFLRRAQFYEYIHIYIYTCSCRKNLAIRNEYFETLGLILGRCDIDFVWWISSDLRNKNF